MSYKAFNYYAETVCISSPDEDEVDDRSENVKQFLEAVTLLELKYGVELGHQDGQGAFVVHHRANNKKNCWLLAAEEKLTFEQYQFLHGSITAEKK